MGDLLQDYMRLFNGRKDAYGTGRGQWIKREPTPAVYQEHLDGRGPGLGVAPLLDDGTVWFAAIDLDEPDFDAAREMQDFLSFGVTYVERSRSGNAHVWAFFENPIQAWIARGILREATAAIGKPAVEVFPKQDKLREGMVGNYINLPYHGDDRPILDVQPMGGRAMAREAFVANALARRNDPTAWERRARWLMIEPPEQRLKERQDFGTGKELHICAEWIIANRDENPIMEGHRNVVYFNLAKMLRHYEGFSDEDAFGMLQLVRDSSDEQGVDHVSDHELHRLFDNASGFTSTGCDDPLMGPYVHPDCPIAHGARR
jgi:hypothetical protein